GHGRRRRYRRIGRHADQRGDRRIGSDGRQVDGLPGLDPGNRRAGGDPPALLVGVDHVVPVSANHHDGGVWTGFRHLRALLPDVPAPQRRVLVVRGGDYHGGGGGADPLLLRLQSPGRRRGGGGGGRGGGGV